MVCKLFVHVGPQGFVTTHASVLNISLFYSLCFCGGGLTRPRVRAWLLCPFSLHLRGVYLMRRGDNSAKNILLGLLFLKTAPDWNG